MVEEASRSPPTAATSPSSLPQSSTGRFEQSAAHERASAEKRERSRIPSVTTARTIGESGPATAYRGFTLCKVPSDFRCNLAIRHLVDCLNTCDASA
jgi:hypothetical protein